MYINTKSGFKLTGLILTSLFIAGCGGGDDITNIFPNDPTTDNGGDRTSGGSFSTGTWKASGVNADNNPFNACFNLSVDGSKLTKVGSTCTSYQNAFSIDVDGSTDCNFYYDGDVAVASDGTFSVSNFQPDPRAPVLSMQGSYNNGDANGTITVDNTAWGGTVCTAKWHAYAPGNTSTDDVIADTPDNNTTPPGDRPAAGTWTGSGTNAEGDSFTACLVVNSDGTKLIRNNTCTGNQGQNDNQFDVQIERGDNDCYLYLGDGDADSQIEVPIVNNRIALNNYNPSSFAPTLSFEGTFNGDTVSGTITVSSQYPNGSCKGSWSASAP